MKDSAEKEKSLFLNAAESQPLEHLAKDRAVEVKYDLTNHVKKGPDEEKLPHFLTLCDFLLVTTIVLVNVIGFWRGLFGILLHFREIYQLWLLYLLGSLIYFYFTVSRAACKRHLKKKSVCNSILRKAYTYVFGSACIIQWAGLWYILDAMSGYDPIPPLVYSVVCGAILVAFKVFRNLLAPPLSFCTDSIDGFFDFQTVFKTTPSKFREQEKIKGARYEEYGGYGIIRVLFLAKICTTVAQMWAFLASYLHLIWFLITKFGTNSSIHFLEWAKIENESKQVQEKQLNQK